MIDPFPECEKCRRLRAEIEHAEHPVSDYDASETYARHLYRDHGLPSREVHQITKVPPNNKGRFDRAIRDAAGEGPTRPR